MGASSSTTTRSSSSNNSGFRKYSFSPTPAWSCITESINSSHLNMPSIFMSVVYLTLFLCCGLSARDAMFQDVHYELYQNTTKDTENLLMNMLNDTQYCGHCIHKYSSNKKIELMTNLERMRTKQENILKVTKTTFNILSVINVITTFVIFGGPKSITIATLINTLMVFLSLYVSTSLVIYFESFIIILSVVTYVKSLEALNKSMITINMRRQPAKEHSV
ncbi:unnamed protein product [Rotaria sp. Silwood2]|nr:unnamed protein product [Rotaria sp. Silwood2]CAF3971863.1 unnamed protein product [Rotaria sp. Silwood2]